MVLFIHFSPLVFGNLQNNMGMIDAQGRTLIKTLYSKIPSFTDREDTARAKTCVHRRYFEAIEVHTSLESPPCHWAMTPFSKAREAQLRCKLESLSFFQVTWRSDFDGFVDGQLRSPKSASVSTQIFAVRVPIERPPRWSQERKESSMDNLWIIYG